MRGERAPSEARAYPVVPRIGLNPPTPVSGEPANWTEFVPAMRNKVMSFEVVDEEEWEHRLNAMLAG